IAGPASSGRAFLSAANSGVMTEDRRQIETVFSLSVLRHPSSVLRLPEHRFELRTQRHIDFRHAHGNAKIDKTGDAVARFAHAVGTARGTDKADNVGAASAGSPPAEGHGPEKGAKPGAAWGVVAVRPHNPPPPHADGGDLVLVPGAAFRPGYPDADPVFPPFA